VRGEDSVACEAHRGAYPTDSWWAAVSCMAVIGNPPGVLVPVLSGEVRASGSGAGVR
jgi:hypothetical protein